MQVLVTMPRAWNWLTNTADGASHFTGCLEQSHTHVDNTRAQHPGLRDLTGVEHENNALSVYRSGGYYYVPNTEYTDWIVNPNNSLGVNYANNVRQNLRD